MALVIVASVSTVSSSAVSGQLFQVLGALLLLTTFAIVAVKLLGGAIQMYAVQSFVLALAAFAVAFFTNSSDLYIVGALTIIVKSAAIPWILRNVSNRLHVQREIRPYLAIPASLLVCGLLTLLAFFASPSVVATGA